MKRNTGRNENEMAAIVRAPDGSIGFLVSSSDGIAIVNWISGDNDEQIASSSLTIVPCTGSDEDVLS